MVSATDRVAVRPWRPMGFGSQPAHVGVDFSAPPPYAVTAVLIACLRDPDGQPPGPELAWSWSIASRLQGLLAVVMATDDRDLDIQVNCQRCQEALGLDLPLRRFVLEPPGDQRLSCEADGARLWLRLPTGRDQQHWLGRDGVTTEQMAVQLLAEPGQAEIRLTPAQLAAMEAALEDADPFTALELETQCPCCQAGVQHPLDLEACLLQRLQGVLTGLLRDIHRLAMAYHWSEAEILALPAQRRDFYLACVGREGRR